MLSCNSCISRSLKGLEVFVVAFEPQFTFRGAVSIALGNHT